jgi:hypothetical protein
MVGGFGGRGAVVLVVVDPRWIVFRLPNHVVKAGLDLVVRGQVLVELEIKEYIILKLSISNQVS